MKRWLFLVSILAFGLSSCSVMMAANSTGASLKTIQKAATREDLVACGAILIESERVDDGKVDTFKIAHERGSISRALVNGMLDLTTGFLWELAATPIEIAYAKDSFFKVKVTFDGNDNIRRVEIL